MIRPNKNPVLQRQAVGRRSDKINRSSRGFQHWMDRDRNRADPKQTNTFGISDPDRLGVGHFLFRKRHSFAEDPLLLFHRPVGGKRKKLFQLLEGGLSIHDCLKSKNSAEQTQKLACQQKSRAPAELRDLSADTWRNGRYGP